MKPYIHVVLVAGNQEQRCIDLHHGHGMQHAYAPTLLQFHFQNGMPRQGAGLHRLA